MMRNYLDALIVGFCISVATLPAQVNVGRNHRTAAVSLHGTAAIEFEPDKDASIEEASELDFTLPDVAFPIRMQRKGFDQRSVGSGFWRGTVAGRSDSEVMLTSHEGFLAGTIRLGGGLYEIRPSPRGQIVERIDSSSFPACGGSLDLALTADTRDSSPVTNARQLTGVKPIDLLSVYTPQARAAAGGVAQINTIIQAAVDLANQSFSNSEIAAVYRLVKTEEASREDSGDLNQDLAWLASDAAIASLRNQVGADLVSLIVEDGGGFCGMGYAMRSPGSGFAAGAFQVTRRSCAVSNLSFAHEHGHNLGMEHDPSYGAPPANASYPWSFGQIVNGVFRTVMSYPNGCPNGCERLAYFSNPNVSYLGHPTGVSGTNDNARTANLTASIVAAFRSAPADALSASPPAAPSGLAVTQVSANQVSLAWVDQTADEAGFRIERSQNHGTFSVAATLGPNASAYVNTGLASSTLYSYRVRAFGASEESGYSNTVTTTTLPSPVPVAPAGLRAVVAGPGQIILFWLDSPADVEGFRIEKAIVGGGFVEIAIVGAETSSYSNNGLAAGMSYSFRLRAYNRSGNSGYSNIVYATIAAAAPNAPTPPAELSGIAAFWGAGLNRYLSAVRVTWRDGVGESAYRLEKCRAISLAEACTYAPFRTFASNVSGTLDTSMNGAKGIYKYRVRGENNGGNSTWVETTVDAR